MRQSWDGRHGRRRGPDSGRPPQLHGSVPRVCPPAGQCSALAPVVVDGRSSRRFWRSLSRPHPTLSRDLVSIGSIKHTAPNPLSAGHPGADARPSSAARPRLGITLNAACGSELRRELRRDVQGQARERFALLRQVEGDRRCPGFDGCDPERRRRVAIDHPQRP